MDQLLEWYENLGQDNGSMENMNKEVDQEENPKKQSNQEVDKELDKWSDLYKALAIVRLLENKLMLLSDVFQSQSDDQRENLLKLVKEIIKKLNEIFK